MKTEIAIRMNSVFRRDFKSKMDPMFTAVWKGTYKESLKRERPLLEFIRRGKR